MEIVFSFAEGIPTEPISDSPERHGGADISWMFGNLHEAEKIVGGDVNITVRWYHLDEELPEYAGHLHPSVATEIRIPLKPLEVEGKVRTLFDGHCTSDGLGGGERNNGLTAVLQIGEIKVVITEYLTNNAHPITYRCVGLEPKDAQIVVTKSHLNFRAHYSPFASKIIIPKADGLATPDFKKLPYKNIPRPFYPFDQEEEKFQENP